MKTYIYIYDESDSIISLSSKIKTESEGRNVILVIPFAYPIMSKEASTEINKYPITTGKSKYPLKNILVHVEGKKK